MFETTDKHLLEFLCSTYGNDKGWTFKKYKANCLGHYDAAAETQTTRDRLSKWKKMRQSQPEKFRELCEEHGVEPTFPSKQKCSNKTFLVEVGDDLVFCQHTFNSDPQGDPTVHISRDGTFVSVKFAKYIPTTAAERLQNYSFAKDMHHRVVNAVYKKQEELNSELTREDFEPDDALFHFDKEVVRYIVDENGNEASYKRFTNPDGNAVISFFVLKTEAMIRKATSPTKSFFSLPVPDRIDVSTRSVDHGSKSMTSTCSTESREPMSWANRLGISPVVQSKKDDMEVDEATEKRFQAIESSTSEILQLLRAAKLG